MNSALCDVLVIGAGPAGISAALWLSGYGLDFHWVDANAQPGGLLHRVHNRIDNYPGGPFEDGKALADCLASQLEQLSWRKQTELSPEQSRVQRLDLDGDHIVATLENSTSLTARRLILATGTRYRRLGVAGESEGLGRCVSQSATADGPRFAGQSVAVVGGGDAGFENALILSELGCQVFLLLRSHEFRARPAFVRAVEADKNIRLLPIPTIVTSISPSQRGCRLNLSGAGEENILDVAALFVRIGVEPVVPAGLTALARDTHHFLLVDEKGRSSDPRVFAAGDVTATALRSVATAVANGAIAARTCAFDLNYL